MEKKKGFGRRKYFPNGQVKLRDNYHDGEIFDTSTKYYSTGKIKGEKILSKMEK